jgi:hypothetical protein
LKRQAKKHNRRAARSGAALNVYVRSTLTVVVLVELAVAAMLPALVILLTLLASVIAAALLTTLAVALLPVLVVLLTLLPGVIAAALLTTLAVALLPVLVVLLTLLPGVIAAALLTSLAVLVGVIVANIVLILVRHFAFLSYACMGIQETTMVRLRSTARAERVEIRDGHAMVEIAAGRPCRVPGKSRAFSMRLSIWATSSASSDAGVIFVCAHPQSNGAR